MNASTIEICADKPNTWEASVPKRYSAALNTYLQGGHDYFVLTGSVKDDPAYDVFVFAKGPDFHSCELEKGLRIFGTWYGLTLLNNPPLPDNAKQAMGAAVYR